jgi:hypothetical protein
MSSEPTYAAEPTVRLARHTGAFDEIVAFYRDGVGLPVLGSFDDHDGYSGIIFGLPGSDHQLEFTAKPGEDGDHAAASPDDLIALYFDTRGAADEVVARLAKIAEVTVPANPYWRTRVESICFLDPDGWRVVVAYPLATSTASSR